MKNADSIFSCPLKYSRQALVLLIILLGCQKNPHSQVPQSQSTTSFHCDAFNVEVLTMWQQEDTNAKGYIIPMPVILPDQAEIFEASRMGISISRLVVDGNRADSEKTIIMYDAPPGHYTQRRTIAGGMFVYQLLFGNRNDVFDEETDYGIETETTEGEVEFFRISPSWKEIEISYQLMLPTGLTSEAYVVRVER